jgi:hypothetical protein
MKLVGAAFIVIVHKNDFRLDLVLIPGLEMPQHEQTGQRVSGSRAVPQDS